MIKPMSRIADAFWRAAAYCLHPRVIGLSLLPLIVSARSRSGSATSSGKPPSPACARRSSPGA